jgi:uncharacterized damage-inducible protein DinB
MARNYFFQIAHTPATLIRLVDCIRPDQYDVALGEDKFTLREIIAHMADLEETFLNRITQAVEYPGTEVENFDQEQRAIDHHYSTKDIHHELDVFDNRRRDTVAYLSGLAESDWENTVLHPVNGAMTVLDIVMFAVGHDMYHVHQVSEYLK